jgi:regulator of sigma E protease
VNILVSIVGLAFLILVHEAGHFSAALAVRMRPRKFYVFFPPALAKTVRNGIEYGIGSIPLGGYVKIPGMHQPAGADLDAQFGRAIDEAPWLTGQVARARSELDAGRLEEARGELVALRRAVETANLTEPAQKSALRGIEDADDACSPEAYWRAPAWKRITVIFAGPAANLVLAVVLLAIVYMLGVPTGVTSRVDEVVAGSPAVEMGLEPGDEIVAVGGRTVAADEISQTIRDSEGAAIAVTVEREGEEVVLGPAAPREIDGAYRLGFVLDAETESYGPLRALGLAAEETWYVTKAIFSSLGRLVTGEGREDVASPVGIVQGSSQALDEGFNVYLRILAFISLSLALLNLLPLLPLDGGHIAMSIAEKIRGRAIPRSVYERISAVGIAVVLLLFVIGLSNDIDRLNGG